jgi:hypothetical protein
VLVPVPVAAEQGDPGHEQPVKWELKHARSAVGSEGHWPLVKHAAAAAASEDPDATVLS